MFFRLLKFATGVAYILLACLTWRWFTGSLDWGFAVGSALLSGFWLVLTRLQMRQLFQTYFDTLSRARVLIPVWIGIVLSGAAIYAAGSLPLQVVAGLELAAWGYIYWLYRANRKRFIQQGHGPLPAGCWVNPDPAVMQPGDIILTSGRLSKLLSESLGHGEVVVRMPDGSISAFTSYMEKGASLNAVADLCKKWVGKGEHYVVLRLKTPLTSAQVVFASQYAVEMLAENDAWRKRTNEWRARIIGLLPLPAAAKAFLVRKTTATGYDWVGLFFGSRARHRWTCVAACLELYDRLEVKHARYGTGLLGLGSGFLDPIMPVRFLADPHLRILDSADRARHEAGSRRP